MSKPPLTIEDIVLARAILAETNGAVYREEILAAYLERALEMIEQHRPQMGVVERERDSLMRELNAQYLKYSEPVRMHLDCPHCYAQHVDEGEFATKPHKVHECQNCGRQFKPADRPTVGVRFLGRDA